jgi:hypothetical protein
MARVSRGVTTTPTPTLSQVMARAGNPESVEKDKDKVRDYVKEKLYERVIFNWKKSSIDQGGMFHRDYMSNCRLIIADGTLVNAKDN